MCHRDAGSPSRTLNPCPHLGAKAFEGKVGQLTATVIEYRPVGRIPIVQRLLGPLGLWRHVTAVGRPLGGPDIGGGLCNEIGDFLTGQLVVRHDACSKSQRVPLLRSVSMLGRYEIGNSVAAHKRRAVARHSILTVAAVCQGSLPALLGP